MAMTSTERSRRHREKKATEKKRAVEVHLDPETNKKIEKLRAKWGLKSVSETVNKVISDFQTTKKTKTAKRPKQQESKNTISIANLETCDDKIFITTGGTPYCSEKCAKNNERPNGEYQKWVIQHGIRCRGCAEYFFVAMKYYLSKSP